MEPLGARRGRLVGQLVTESLLLALTGGILGILLAKSSLFLVKHLGPESIPHLHEIGLDLSVFAFALGITLITGILFGLAPAFGATRMNLVEVLKEGGQRSGGSASAPRIRNALLISQVALALVLVVSAGLLVRTFHHMVNANSGFDATHVVTFEVPLPTTKYSDTDRMAQLYQQVSTATAIDRRGGVRRLRFGRSFGWPIGRHAISASRNTRSQIPHRVRSKLHVRFAGLLCHHRRTFATRTGTSPTETS